MDSAPAAQRTTLRETLSVAIIACNEEQILPRTLASVAWADEIVVVDSGSSDRTVELARSAGARVLTEPWRGFAAQKNFAIEQCSSPWILSLDADEELSEPLQQEILALLIRAAQGASAMDAYRLRRRNLFLGRAMLHGGFYPDPKLRLFRRIPTQTETPPRFAERPVHENLVFQGPCGELRHDLIHHAYPTLTGYLEHMNRYSTLGAKIAIGKGKTSRSWPAFVANIVLAPALTFVWNYIFRGGFLDGREGLLLHLYHSAYVSSKYAKAWHESQRR